MPDDSERFADAVVTIMEVCYIEDEEDVLYALECIGSALRETLAMWHNREGSSTH